MLEGDRFGRVLTATIGRRGRKGWEFSEPYSIECSADYRRDGSTPKSSLRITNPPPEVAAEVRAAPGTETFVSVVAGYRASGASTILSGTIDQKGSSLSYSGPDRILDLQVLHGGASLQAATTALSVASPVAAQVVAGQAIRDMGLRVGDLSGLAGKGIPNAVHVGASWRLLEKLADRWGLDVIVGDGVVSVLNKDAPLSVRRVPRFSHADKTLLGHPEEVEKGTKIRALLDPRIRPGYPFVIEYESPFDRSKTLTRRLVASQVTFTASVPRGAFHVDVLGSG